MLYNYSDNSLNGLAKIAIDDVAISIIVPVFNEQEVLDELFIRLRNVLDNLGISYEVIFIDDGSTDNSLGLLKEFYFKNKRFKTVSFSRNFGHQVAVSAGLDLARGKAVVVIDADLQDPPELIPDFIEEWKKGYKVVYAIRKERKENIIKKTFYKVYYRLLHQLADIDIPLDSGDFCLMDCQVAQLISSLQERTRFVRGLRSWAGFKQIGVEYERDKRFAGKSKYTFRKLLTLALDGVISFSGVPLKIAIVIGFIISSFSFIYAVYIVLNRVFFNITGQIPGWTSIVVAIMFLGGVQLIIIGLVGEYIARIFNEVKCRPLYVLKDKVGFDD